MRRGMIAGMAGWAAFAAVMWMWNSDRAPGRVPVRPAVAGAPRTSPLPIETPGQETREVVVVMPAHPMPGEPVKARARVTLETLSVAAAITDLTPGDDMADVIQMAAARAGRAEWFTADWDGDGTLSPADVSAFASAFRGKSVSADINHDGRLDTADFLEFLREFNEREHKPVAVAAAVRRRPRT